MCTIFEINDEAGTDYIVMQYVEGMTLKELLDGEKIEIERAVHIAIQVAEGVAVPRMTSELSIAT